ncbi:MAG: hypothetical protein ACUVXA_16805 [Candidatus Jordarchaeum sp.]|uniref:hypothetical protein n=1 Tax=Candidatus Jordarchaeum sp. TaxID=2823881 RepID=UPI0040499A6B
MNKYGKWYNWGVERSKKEMMRTNTFQLKPAGEQTERLFKLADNCSRMYNEINYRRRQSFFSGNFDWKTDEEYHRYKKLVGSATAQQILRKNDESWKSFFALLKKWKTGKLERKPRPPGILEGPEKRGEKAEDSHQMQLLPAGGRCFKTSFRAQNRVEGQEQVER